MSLPPSLLACATCSIDQGSTTYQAASTAIFFMVGLIGAVLAAILFIIINFARKQRRYAQSHPS